MEGLNTLIINERFFYIRLNREFNTNYTQDNSEEAINLPGIVFRVFQTSIQSIIYTYVYTISRVSETVTLFLFLVRSNQIYCLLVDFYYLLYT